jgi:hypothetical protein
LYFAKYPLFRDPANRAIYMDYMRRAEAAKIQFLQVGDIRIYRLGNYERNNSSLEYWDQLIKLQLAPAIQPTKYLNLWVCFNMDSPFLGYGQYPKINRSPMEVLTDGCVFFVTIFPFHLYKTVTHELGHWLGLNHLFQQDEDTMQYNDNISDTPYQEKPTFGDPMLTNEWPMSYETVNGRRNPSKHMWMCYMDYTDDMRMLMFTKEQVKKMRQVLQTLRSEYILSSTEVSQLWALNKHRIVVSPSDTTNFNRETLTLPNLPFNGSPTRNTETKETTMNPVTPPPVDCPDFPMSSFSSSSSSSIPSKPTISRPDTNLTFPPTMTGWERLKNLIWALCGF